MRFAQNTVEDERYGVPFLTSTTMLQADLSTLPLISRKMAESAKYRILRIQHGMTLISCSGAIGRMVYTRSDMEGIWSSQDVVKILPNSSEILSGYLYAYLSSPIGIELAKSGTYGALVPHIEREHLVRLPIPRLGDEVEQLAHALVERAAESRSNAAAMLRQAQEKVRSLFPSGAANTHSVWGVVNASRVQSRLDAYYFSERCMMARRAFDDADVDDHCTLGEVAEVFIPGIFKRRYADDPEFGYPYITGGDVFQISPTSDQYLLRPIADKYRLRVSKRTILIQEAGQLGGLIGRSALVGTYLDGFAVSNNMVRVTTNDDLDTGYVFALLSTSEGVRLIARESAGSSIPHIDVNRVRNIRIPWPSIEVRREIGELVTQAQTLRDQACVDENEARAIVERVIEDAS
ncbi:restriction endonuclease subunit S [Nocardia sp. NPDC059246]|uniref:methylation-associated defense system restriction endonuclease subunit S MAD5 n=1 Tax=unclassified Nocardia TaxID=2637762 RepID=UPI0036C101D1